MANANQTAEARHVEAAKLMIHYWTDVYASPNTAELVLVRQMERIMNGTALFRYGVSPMPNESKTAETLTKRRGVLAQTYSRQHLVMGSIVGLSVSVAMHLANPEHWVIIIPLLIGCVVNPWMFLALDRLSDLTGSIIRRRVS